MIIATLPVDSINKDKNRTKDKYDKNNTKEQKEDFSSTLAKEQLKLKNL